MSIFLKVKDPNNKGFVSYTFWKALLKKLWWCPLAWPIFISYFIQLVKLEWIGRMEDAKNRAL